MKNAIKVKDIVKKYNTNFQLGPINLELSSGCIIGLIGENGAGKTTLLKSILNIIEIDQGTIHIFDEDYKRGHIKEEIGVVLDNTFFPELLTPNDIQSIMKGIYKSWDSELFQKYLTKFSLPSNKALKTMSKGMRKKVEIITALSHHPKLLICDEATSGLDPIARNEVLDLFLNFIQDEDHTVLLSTHITSELEHIADQIIFINNGRILLNNSRDELLDNYGILKCSIEQFENISKEDILKYKQNKYDYEILVKDREKIANKYKNYIIDKITLEELMVLMIRGEKK